MELGRKGWGRVHPNPLVGCVIVRDGEVVGEGWHAEYGGPHAEVVALAAAGNRSNGAEVFVSLEPCRHQGQTPPCTDALLAAGVSRVVFGASDPGEESGGGGPLLAAKGIAVIGPAMTAEEARWENPTFFAAERERPWTALKLALSLDGRIAARAGERGTLSGREALEEVHRLRAGFDGILVGTGTAIADDPLLTVRGPVEPRIAPRRILLDATGKLGPRAQVFGDRESEVWIVTTPESPKSWRRVVEEKGAILVDVPATAGGRVDLDAAMKELRRRGIESLLCEGGGEVASSLLSSGLVDRLYLALAPRFLGEEGVPAFPGLPSPPVAGAAGAAWSFGEAPRRLGEDLWLALKPGPTEESS
ncbi:MAG: bifunctional diaminohydroxyphosphoribosylaminopyrimidine deaminase/5-amino-6-(5-phosphoribosylamino)uracil reductase RibD [Gemmatimonadota bacterium]